MKSISHELLHQIDDRHGRADLQWTRSMTIPGDDDFPVLELPADRVRYATDRGYPFTFAARKLDGRGKEALLFVQVESFAIAGHDEARWAVPGRYTPNTVDQHISAALGFDEGWDDAEFECAFVCDARFATFWRAVVDRKRFGLTVPEMMSLYPVALAKRELEPLAKILAAWR